MPLQIPGKELQAILETVGSSISGASGGDLMAEERLEFKRRTLQRRLDLLTNQGRLVARGKGRGRRYLVPAPLTEPASEQTTDSDWRSTEAREIRTLLASTNRRQRHPGSRPGTIHRDGRSRTAEFT